jgi:hypothetical protein
LGRTIYYANVVRSIIVIYIQEMLKLIFLSQNYFTVLI